MLCQGFALQCAVSLISPARQLQVSCPGRASYDLQELVLPEGCAVQLHNAQEAIICITGEGPLHAAPLCVS